MKRLSVTIMSSFNHHITQYFCVEMFIYYESAITMWLTFLKCMCKCEQPLLHEQNTQYIYESLFCIKVCVCVHVNPRHWMFVHTIHTHAIDTGKEMIISSEETWKRTLAIYIYPTLTIPLFYLFLLRVFSWLLLDINYSLEDISLQLKKN